MRSQPYDNTLRMFRRLRGRLKEVEVQQAHGLQPSTTLLKKIHRSLHWFPATAAGDINQSSSSRAGAQGLSARIQQWRSRLRSSTKQTVRWLGSKPIWKRVDGPQVLAAQEYTCRSTRFLKLRPSVVAGLIAARLRSPQAQSWYAQQLAAQQHGCCRKKDAFSATATFAEAHANSLWQGTGQTKQFKHWCRADFRQTWIRPFCSYMDTNKRAIKRGHECRPTWPHQLSPARLIRKPPPKHLVSPLEACLRKVGYAHQGGPFIWLSWSLARGPGAWCRLCGWGLTSHSGL